jgi:hypothetical protein
MSERPESVLGGVSAHPFDCPTHRIMYLARLDGTLVLGDILFHNCPTLQIIRELEDIVYHY